MSKERQLSFSTPSSPTVYEHTWLVLCGGWYWLDNSFWYCSSSLRPDTAAAFEHERGMWTEHPLRVVTFAVGDRYIVHSTDVSEI